MTEAKFPLSEDYAGLMKELREDVLQFNLKDTAYENIAKDAADALEALLAERDALKAELIDYKDAAASEADFVNELGEKIRELNVEIDKWESAYKEITYTRVKIEETTVDKLKKVECERDALRARLAPVDDKELVEIAAGAINDGSKNIARAAIAAIRPHIEAAERERCAKAVEKVAGRINVPLYERPAYEDGYLQGVHDAAAAIRSGKWVTF